MRLDEGELDGPFQKRIVRVEHETRREPRTDLDHSLRPQMPKHAIERQAVHMPVGWILEIISELWLLAVRERALVMEFRELAQEPKLCVLVQVDPEDLGFPGVGRSEFLAIPPRGYDRMKVTGGIELTSYNLLFELLTRCECEENRFTAEDPGVQFLDEVVLLRTTRLSSQNGVVTKVDELGVGHPRDGRRLRHLSAIDELLRNPDRGIEPLKTAYHTIDGAYHFVHRLIRMFYNPHAINWAEMGSAEAVIHKRHESAMAAGHYVLAGDFFEQHEKYTEFFRLLEDPRHFEKYKTMVIDRETYWVQSCQPDPAIVFNPLIEEHEPQRAEEDERVRERRRAD